MVSIHSNVKIATDVYFCTHDVLHKLFNDNSFGGGKYKRYSEPIEIFDNVFIGAKSTIMYGVKIGPMPLWQQTALLPKTFPRERL
ncbi:MAG: hypothetical protein LUD77_00435 [Clostridiales bacterium]|nr:hypothetical protein [Clostridiales bacterium]